MITYKYDLKMERLVYTFFAALVLVAVALDVRLSQLIVDYLRTIAG